jgi:ABC-2 type transport system permease protein
VSPWRQVRLVARREFGERIRQPGWKISTAVTIAIVVGAAILAAVLGGDDTERWTVGATGAEAAEIARVARAAAPAADAEIDVERFPSASDARAAVRDEDADAAVARGTLLVGDEAPEELERLLAAAAREVRSAARLRAEGLSPDEVRSALDPVPLRTVSLSGENDDERTGVAFVASLLLYGQLIFYGLAVATGVVEEKASRVVEVLLAAIEPRSLLAGKVIGIGLLGLAQLALVVLAGLVAASASGAVELDGTTFATLGVVLVWFLFGYAFYACLYAVSGVLVSRQEDLQSSSAPLTALLVLGYLVALPAVYNPTSTLAQIAGLVPFCSPMVMPALVAQGEASAAEIAVSLGLLAGGVAVLIPLGARIYEAGILRMGRPVKLVEVWRSARV